MRRLLDRINMRNLVIVFLCITVILMAIGYAIISMKLKEEDPFYEVSIIKVEKISSVNGGSINPIGKHKIKSSNQRIDFNFTLNNPYDELIYRITIKNTGNVPAEIKDIAEYPEYTKDEKLIKSLSPIEMSYNDVTETILEPDEETEINLVIQFDHGESRKVEFNYSMVLITSSPNK